MKDIRPDDAFFKSLAATEEKVGRLRAPSRLKSRVFSALIKRQQQSGPLATLDESKTEGRDLCVFEELARLAPLAPGQKSFNYCRICHARVLGEKMENAPIFWDGCPYVRFQNR